MFQGTRCDAIMIGRAASHNPWIFRQIDEFVRTGRYAVPPDRDRYRLMKRYYLMLQEHGELDAVGKMKQFATYFTHGVRNGAKLRTEIYRAHEVASILERVDEFFSVELSGAVAAQECAEVA
jgi:tRNA-dihydrouridine synthase